MVEDDPIMRMAAPELVTDASCEVFEAADADEAIRILEGHPEITVLFTDIDMPGSMDGLRLAEIAKAKRPELTIVVVSGHRSPGADLPEGASFFSKPYSPSEIRSAIKACWTISS